MTPQNPEADDLDRPDVPLDIDIDDFTTVVETFAGIFIRLPSVEKLSFTTLSVLHTLTHNGPKRLSELTATEQVSQPAITQLVARLERDGLVERGPDPADRRAVLVRVTTAGARIVRTRHRDRVTQLAGLFDQLTPEERGAVGAALPALMRMAELGLRP
ncbi:MarR family winged helix-turn-helix transcriptional regulator [Streptomyces sp. SAS_270]|uniref:MarR family winged helix-turn-helix transcriptional regulator n=1 Tax=Streptomyces sp. SAS_270 TaxID=3412748 RepID=UPI00403C283F